MRLALKDFAQPRPIAAAVLIAGFAASLWANWPGHLEFDSILQLRDGRSGVYDSWHPPVMAWLLGLGDALVPGAALFVAFDTALAFGALLSLLWLSPRVPWHAVAAAAVAVLLPQIFLYQAIVWKDVLFADAALCGFVCLAHAGAKWERQAGRLALLAGAALFLALAALTRQNGALLLPCAALALGAIAARTEGRLAGVLYGTGLLAVCAVLIIAGNAALQLRSDNNLGVVKQIKVLERYDLAGMVKRRPGLELRVLEKESPALAKLIRSDGVRLYSPAANDTLTASAALQKALAQTPADVLARQWRATILAHPLDYLATRATLFGWVFLSLHPEQCPAYTVGVDGPAAPMRALGIGPRFDARDEALDSYAQALVGTPVFSHPAYAFVALLCLILLLRRRAPADLALAGLLAGALAFTLSFFFVSMACEYRYLYMLDLSAIAAALYLFAATSRAPKT